MLPWPVSWRNWPVFRRLMTTVFIDAVTSVLIISTVFCRHDQCSDVTSSVLTSGLLLWGHENRSDAMAPSSKWPFRKSWQMTVWLNFLTSFITDTASPPAGLQSLHFANYPSYSVPSWRRDYTGSANTSLHQSRLEQPSSGSVCCRCPEIGAFHFWLLYLLSKHVSIPRAGISLQSFGKGFSLGEEDQ